MTIKHRIRSILGETLHRKQICDERDRLVNHRTVKNVILDDQALPVQLSSQASGGFIRVLATDSNNAREISSILKRSQDDLGIRELHVIDKALEYKPHNPKEKPIFDSSVLLRIDNKVALQSAIQQSGNYLRDQLFEEDINNRQPERIVIDFSSPNIAKPFHFGHLKSTILGNYLANLNKFAGNHVTKLNYIGDWGTQYGLLNAGLDEFAYDEEQLKKSPLKLLLDIYVKANERGKWDDSFYTEARRRFFQLEDGQNCDMVARWRNIRDLSVDELKKSYTSLGIEFDVFECESDYAKRAIELVDQMQSKGLVYRSEEGVLTIQIEKNNRPLRVPLVKSDNASLYISRDVAAVLSRQERFQFDKMIYVVGADQEKHFHSLREIVRKLGHHEWADNLIHVKTGKVLGMSSRSGNFVLLSEIVDELTRRYIETTSQVPTGKTTSKQEIDEVGRHLALAALFVFDMRNLRTRSYEFDWDQVLMAGSRSGIHLQTSHARLCSLQRRAEQEGVKPLDHDGDDEDYNACFYNSSSSDDHQMGSPVVRANDLESKLNPSAISCVEAVNLISLMNELDTALHGSRWLMDPSQLVNHGLALAKAINRARQSTWLSVILENDESRARTKLTLFKRARQQLAFVIRLIGLKPLERV